METKNIFGDKSNTDGINEALRISLLAEFSKSCGVTQSDMNALGAKTDSFFASYQKIDYNLFKNSTEEIFKESISNLIYNSFFSLLTKNSNFQLTMFPILGSFQKGKISAQDLRMILLDNLSDTIANIITRLQKGENLSEEEISNIVTNSIVSKKEKIASDVLTAASKTTAPDGLSAYTPYTGLAISQRFKGIKWRAIKGGGLSNKAIERLQKTTKNIKTQLEKTKSALRTARSIVGLLKKLESIVSNGYVNILKSLSKIIFSYVRDIGSSGVYVLNMIEPYSTLDPFMDAVEMKDLKDYGGSSIEKIERIKLFEKINRENIISSYESYHNDLYRSNVFLSDFSPQELEDAKIGGFQEALEKINSIYKPTTYASFIRTINDAFFDDGDMPGDSFLNQKNLFDFSAAETFGTGTGTVKRTSNKFNTKNGINLDFIRPGRPRFGNGSNSVVVIVAFSMPNVINLISSTAVEVEAFLMLMNFLTHGWFGYNTKDRRIGQWISENLDSGKKRWLRFWGKTAKKRLYDYYDNQPYLDEDGDIMIPTDVGQDPDFYGFAVRSLFPGFFELMDILEQDVDKYTRNFKSSLSKELDALLKNIEEAIDDLEDFINTIDRIINFFSLLKTSGLSVLQITSNGGNDDISQKLLAAEGFPGVEDGDPLRLIGGMVYCYGTPNLEPGNIDFQGIIKQQMTVIDYEAALAKYESGGKNSDDDPGTLQEYLSDSGAIGDYNSSLDKIFKKLF